MFFYHISNLSLISYNNNIMDNLSKQSVYDNQCGLPLNSYGDLDKSERLSLAIKAELLITNLKRVTRESKETPQPSIFELMDIAFKADEIVNQILSYQLRMVKLDIISNRINSEVDWTNSILEIENQRVITRILDKEEHLKCKRKRKKRKAKKPESKA